MEAPKISKKYDILLTLIRERMRHFLYQQMNDMLITMGASHKMPSAQDMEFVCTFLAMYMLHLHEVEIDSDFNDIDANKAELFHAFSCVEELKETLKSYTLYMSNIQNFNSEGQA